MYRLSKWLYARLHEEAIHKTFTILLYQADTKKHADRIKDGSRSEGDMLLMAQTIPQFAPWDGGIQVKDDEGNLFCSLGGAGRTSEGDRKLMILAAYKMGYTTNFDDKGKPLQKIAPDNAGAIMLMSGELSFIWVAAYAHATTRTRLWSACCIPEFPLINHPQE